MPPPGSSENARWESSQDIDEKHSVDHVEVHDKDNLTPDFSKMLYLNRAAEYRAYLREAVAEFLGVAMLIIFGAGVDCQVVLSSNPRVAPSPKGDYLSINFGWAVGTAMGVWVSGGISGGHINPAVTLAFAVFRGFPWKKVPIYIFSQVIGGVTGAALVYWNYFHAIDIFEGGEGIRTLKTASLFATYALDYMTNVSCFWSEFLGAAVLVVSVFAMTDKDNMPPPNGLAPLMLFILILGIGASLGMETGYAINPARDLGPRLLTSMVGYGGQVYTFRHHYWLWCPVMGPFLGALSGGLFYDLLLYTGEENIFNKWNSYFDRRNRLGSGRSQQPAAPTDRTSERLV